MTMTDRRPRQVTRYAVIAATVDRPRTSDLRVAATARRTVRIAQGAGVRSARDSRALAAAAGCRPVAVATAICQLGGVLIGTNLAELFLCRNTSGTTATPRPLPTR